MKCPKCGAMLPAKVTSCKRCGWRKPTDYAPPGDKPKGKGDFGKKKVPAKKGY